MSRSSHPAAAPQPGPSAYRVAGSGSYPAATYPATRRENLIGLVCGHWKVIESAADGYWLAVCESCGCSQRVRLNHTITHVPRCKTCGTRSTDVNPRAARERHFARAKYLRK